MDTEKRNAAINPVWVERGKAWPFLNSKSRLPDSSSSGGSGGQVVATVNPGSHVGNVKRQRFGTIEVMLFSLNLIYCEALRLETYATTKFLTANSSGSKEIGTFLLIYCQGSTESLHVSSTLYIELIIFQVTFMHAMGEWRECRSYAKAKLAYFLHCVKNDRNVAHSARSCYSKEFRFFSRSFLDHFKFQ